MTEARASGTRPLFSAHDPRIRLVWDASAIACALNDPARYELEYNRGWRARPSAEMLCGSLWGEWRQWIARALNGMPNDADATHHLGEATPEWFEMHPKADALKACEPRSRNADKATFDTLVRVALDNLPEIVARQKPLHPLGGCEVRFELGLTDGDGQLLCTRYGEPYSIAGYLDMVTTTEAHPIRFEETKLTFAKPDSFWLNKLRHTTQLRTYEWAAAWTASLQRIDNPFLVIDACGVYKRDGVVRSDWVPNNIWVIKPYRVAQWERALAIWLKMFEELAAIGGLDGMMPSAFSPEGQARYETVETSDALIRAYRETNADWARRELMALAPKAPEPWDPRKERWKW